MTVDGTYLGALLEHVRDLSVECLGETTLGIPGNAYVYHTTPPDDCCDQLVVWAGALRSTSSFPRQHVEPVKCRALLLMADVYVRIVRSCWPTVKGDRMDAFPSPDEMNEAALLVAEDGMTLTCCLLAAAQSGNLTPAGFEIDYGEEPDISWGPSTPDPPRGGCVSWTIQFTAELPQCCVPTPAS